MNGKNIVAISQDPALLSILERITRGPFYNVTPFSGIRYALDYIYNSIPSLVIIDLITEDGSSREILNSLKGDPIFAQLPVLAVLKDAYHIPHWDSLLVEDYILQSDIEREGLARINLCVLRSERVVEVNPLTKLPGNISINRQIQRRIDQNLVFALAYSDLDNFKPFNDYYGFTRGDEVIKATGRLILNIVKNRQPGGSFVGHIGGDDFIFIMDTDLVEETSAEIIAAFDRIMPTFYDTPEKEKGYIETTDRQGKQKKFSFVSLSIGVAHNMNRPFSHYGQFTEVASEMKKHAKNTKGSCCRMDRRQGIL